MRHVMVMRHVLPVLVLVLWTACSRSHVVSAPPSYAFCADSAYAYIETQVAFGERVPGSEAHRTCGDWMVTTMKRMGWMVKEQVGYMPNYTGQPQLIRNIMASSPASDSVDSRSRILLCAHWDCRPWADEEPEYAHRFLPVPGANDGASGVGVLMEIARQMSLLDDSTAACIPPIDILFTDVEDMGTPDHYSGLDRNDTWCLGSQLWASSYRDTPAASKPKYRYGILLDMVGDPSATFPLDYFSSMNAASVQNQLWETARRLGYARYFLSLRSAPIVDDHYYISALAGIPCVDIIDYKAQQGTGFPSWWHTREDDMRNIHPQTLDAVGKTVLAVLLSSR